MYEEVRANLVILLLILMFIPTFKMQRDNIRFLQQSMHCNV